MPGLQIHLAIAKRYMEKYDIKEPEKFLEGSIAPDFVFPKEKSHYRLQDKQENLAESLKNSIDFKKFFEENEIQTDYDKAVFQHLLTDKIFFSEFFDDEYINSVTNKEFCEDLYTSYEKIDPYIEEKYNINFTEQQLEKINENIMQSKQEKNLSSREGKNILDMDKIDAFIERVSDMNLEEYTMNKSIFFGK